MLRRYAAQQGHADAHQACLAHLARDVAYALQNSEDFLPMRLKLWLNKAFGLAEGISHLAPSTIAARRRALERTIDDTELDKHGDAATLSHAEWLALLLDRETTWRHDKRLSARLRYAKLRHQAAPEDVDYRSPRGLERRLFETLLSGEWIDAHDNLAICGPTGIGKSWLACAIGHKACRDNRSVLYVRFTRLLDELALARGDGRIASRLKSLASVELLILDDWGLQPLDAQARHDLLEILEDRYGRKSTIVTSQLPTASWHHAIGDSTYADAILDRLLHNAHRVELEGDSLRRTKASIGD